MVQGCILTLFGARNKHTMISCVTLDERRVKKYLDQIVFIDKNCYKSDSWFAANPWDESNYLMNVKDKWCLSAIAVRGDKVCGCLIASGVNDEVCHLNRVFVAQEFRHQGVASLLLNHFENEAIHLHYRKMMLFVHINNMGARMVYERNKWFQSYGSEFRDLCILKNRNPISDCSFLDEMEEENGIYSKCIDSRT